MFTSVKQKFNTWVERRIPASNSTSFKHRQTFILPTNYGYYLLLICILMLIAAINYQNSMAFILTFTLIAIGHNALIYTYRNITGLTVTAIRAEPVFAGQILSIPLKLYDPMRDHFAVGIGTDKAVQKLVDIPMNDMVIDAIEVPVTKRGWYQPERFYIATSYPLGLLRAWSWFRFTQRYLVYPKPVVPPSIDKRGEGSEPANSHQVKAGDEDFYGLRSYREGDAKHKIHWRAYARELGLHTMEFSEPETESVIFDFDKLPSESVELRLSWLTYLILRAEGEGASFGLKLPSQSITLGSGDAHLTQCLKALALFNLPDNATDYSQEPPAQEPLT
jgi:uncharacterized protein (DUF58 family)